MPHPPQPSPVVPEMVEWQQLLGLILLSVLRPLRMPLMVVAVYLLCESVMPASCATDQLAFLLTYIVAHQADTSNSAIRRVFANSTIVAVVGNRSTAAGPDGLPGA